VLLEVLAREFNGVLGCDFSPLNRRYMRECNGDRAILPGPFDPRRKVFDDTGPIPDRAYGRAFAEALRQLFASSIGAHLPEWGVDVRLGEARARSAASVAEVPATRRESNLRSGFAAWPAISEFVTTPDVERP